MSKIIELDRLDKAIKDGDIRLKSIQDNIEKIDKEIAVLGPRKSELEQNIEFHKKEGIIPLAHEYGKTKKELAQVKARLALITSDQKKAIQAVKDIQLIMEKFKKDHYELLKTSDNNVLRVLFGVNRGKK